MKIIIFEFLCFQFHIFAQALLIVVHHQECFVLNCQIVWDEQKKKWVDLNEPEEEVCCDSTVDIKQLKLKC